MESCGSVYFKQFPEFVVNRHKFYERSKLIEDLDFEDRMPHFQLMEGYKERFSRKRTLIQKAVNKIKKDLENQ